MNLLFSVKDKIPDLIFKAFQSTGGDAINSSADRVWIHPRGDVAVIIDGVSGTGTAVRAAEICIDFLYEYPELAVRALLINSTIG